MYFLPMGPSRTLTRAFMAHLKTERPDAISLKETSNRVKGPAQWQVMCRTWWWRERAEAYDRFSALEYATLIDKARDTLLRNANKAAEALANALSSPRLGVAAAKEILDRAGLPGQSNIGIGRLEPYTADELHKAEQEVAAWERDAYGGGQST